MENKINKISFVITDMSSGGAERVMSLLANYFSRVGIETQIIAIKSDRKIYPLDERVRFHYIGCPNGNVMKFLYRLKAIRDEVADSDIVISFLWHCNVYTLLSNLFSRVPIVISERSDPASEMRGKFRYFKWFRNLVYRRADKIVFQTQDAKKYYKGKLNKKGEVIPNPLTPNLPDPIDERHKELIAAGRLTAQKNMKMMVAAFEKIHNVFPDYKLIIYGEGEDRIAIEREIKDKKLGANILMPGFCNNLPEKMKTAKLFLSTSNFEGISNSIIEALALGVPVIATDCPVGGSKEFVKSNYNGTLVAMNDEKAFGDAVVVLLSDKKRWKEYSTNAVSIREKLSVETIGQRWLHVLCEVRNEYYR